MVKFTAGFALASVLSLANATDFKVRVRNLTYLQPFSPMFVVAHTNDVAVFKEGFPASDAVKLMAEDGDNSALVELVASADVAPYICGSVAGDAPVFPGETWRGTLTIDESVCPDPVYSVVSMLSTESNNELCTHIPGPACPADSGNMEDGPGEEFIHVHRGFHGVGPDLGEANYDWRNPVAEVFIARQ
ncbi:conserved unknown protein [Ectocarpus siliculosus]|uniref:Spondin domain-containing protein n=1 Tax=Ectocarpus siliculosus TaxID=2880 RepID=D7G4K5_ECTSI|nr:conserved unknown protein [Ectocarpus siliculosus]|eukprot:CBJ48908.1 conserved unknown protein [Ectocarpus siliculosus]